MDWLPDPYAWFFSIRPSTSSQAALFSAARRIRIGLFVETLTTQSRQLSKIRSEVFIVW